MATIDHLFLDLCKVNFNDLIMQLEFLKKSLVLSYSSYPKYYFREVIEKLIIIN